MVVVIIGLIGTVATPTFRGYMQTQRLHAASRDLVTNLRLARLRAVNERNPWVVMFLINRRQYLMFADSGGGDGLATNPQFIEDNRGNLRPDPGEKILGPFDLSNGVMFGLVTAQNLPNGLSTTTPVSFGGSPPIIVFYTNGSARETGIIMLQLAERVQANDPTGQRAVILYKPTGAARSFTYDPGGNPPWK
jgi:type II secretory pathway pseudopilin PulG